VLPTTPGGSTITTVATANSAATDPNAVNNSATATTAVLAPTSLSATKLATGPFYETFPFTYTIKLTNAGPAVLNDNPGNEMTDQLPSTITLIGASASSGTATADIPNNRVWWNGSIPVGGSVTVTVQANVNSGTAGSTITNQASVAYDADGNGTNEATGTSNAAVFTPAAAADLAVTIGDAPDPVTTGGPALVYTVGVTNNGPSAASSPSLSIPVPSTVGFVSASAPAGWSCITPPVGGNGTVSCTAATLAVAATATFTISVNVLPATPGGSTITTTATASSAVTDLNAVNNSATATTAVLAPTLLSATKQVTGPFYETFPFTYTIKLTNAGPAVQNDNAGNEMTDQLPSTITLIGASASSGTATADIPNNRVGWNGSIPVGGSVTITIQARVNSGTAGSTITNQASVAYDADGNGTNEAAGTSNAAVLTPAPAAEIPAISYLALIALALMLTAVALRHM
jgi:uncharacterized repeat protein (TIGR01451 family)